MLIEWVLIIQCPFVIPFTKSKIIQWGLTKKTPEPLLRDSPLKHVFSCWQEVCSVI